MVLPRAALVGAALGMVVLSGGSLVLYEAAGLLVGATALVGTALIALAVGVWAGAPVGETEVVPVRGRWRGAAAATALAGGFATFWMFYDERLTGGIWSMIGLLVLVALPAYALGLLLPALFAWSEAWEQSLDEAPQGWGVLGTLVMGLLGGLSVGVLATGLGLLTWLSPGPLLLGLAVTLAGPVFLPEPGRPAARENVLHEEWTAFGVLRVTEVVYPGERQPERRLYLNDEEESGELVRSGAPTLGYVAAAESFLAATTPGGATYLFLGGGAYTLPRRIAERDARGSVTVVELDPAVTRLAYRFFGLRKDHDVVSVHGDARAYLEREAPAAAFDRVYVDVYEGQESLPYSLRTREAFAALAAVLRPGGTAVFNLIGVAQGGESLALWSTLRTLEEVFPALALYTHLGPDYPERQNFLVAVAREAGHSFPERAGLFEPWPRDQWPDVAGSVVYRDVFPAPRGERALPGRGAAAPLTPGDGTRG